MVAIIVVDLLELIQVDVDQSEDAGIEPRTLNMCIHLKLLVDEAAKLAMKSHQDISSAHLTTAAVERVPPSISREQQQIYLGFKEQRKASWANS
jgi:hypothetical protein